MNRQAVCVCLGGSTLTANSPHDRRELLCRTESRLGLCVKGVFVEKDGSSHDRPRGRIHEAITREAPGRD